MTSQGDREWDASAYDRLADPQRAWGRTVLARAALRGDETVLDAGCGAGGLTAEILEQLPRGRVIAIDGSAQMVERARVQLEARFGDRVRVEVADLTGFTLERPVDVIFSNAVFHHIPDHPALFRCLWQALRPGGRLVAQCGGGPNLERLRAHVAEVAADDSLLASLVGWDGPWNNADAETTAVRLADAGFIEIATSVTPGFVQLDDAAHARAFLTTINLRSHLSRLGSDQAREHLLDAVVGRLAASDPPFELDHWRLNIWARRPMEG